jgi:hypothetical protein
VGGLPCSGRGFWQQNAAVGTRLPREGRFPDRRSFGGRVFRCANGQLLGIFQIQQLRGLILFKLERTRLDGDGLGRIPTLGLAARLGLRRLDQCARWQTAGGWLIVRSGRCF